MLLPPGVIASGFVAGGADKVVGRLVPLPEWIAEGGNRAAELRLQDLARMDDLVACVLQGERRQLGMGDRVRAYREAPLHQLLDLRPIHQGSGAAFPGGPQAATADQSRYDEDRRGEAEPAENGGSDLKRIQVPVIEGEDDLLWGDGIALLHEGAGSFQRERG